MIVKNVQYIFRSFFTFRDISDTLRFYSSLQSSIHYRFIQYFLSVRGMPFILCWGHRSTMHLSVISDSCFQSSGFKSLESLTFFCSLDWEKFNRLCVPDPSFAHEYDGRDVFVNACSRPGTFKEICSGDYLMKHYAPICRTDLTCETANTWFQLPNLHDSFPLRLPTVESGSRSSI